MYIAYFDETGDDGYPQYSSKLFVLTSLYLHHQNWKVIYDRIFDFRRVAKENWGIPLKTEIHTKALLLNKKPFRNFNLSNTERVSFCREFASFIATLDIDFINVIINKLNINGANLNRYKDVLDTALNFNVQRIENSIKKAQPATKFLIITDEGRVGKMRKTTRKIQKINFVPSKFSTNTYRNEIKLLIEDPLPKNSKESFFIQICDFVSYFVYLYTLKHKSIDKWHNRLSWLELKEVEEIINILQPVLNKEASNDDPFGFVIYPR